VYKMEYDNVYPNKTTAKNSGSELMRRLLCFLMIFSDRNK
jgi:hypothetical protein